MHFTANAEPVAISQETSFDAELDPEIFKLVSSETAVLYHISSVFFPVPYSRILCLMMS